MASMKNFKPHMKYKTKLPKKPAVSLTDEQYEEIFYSAIHPSEIVEFPFKADLPGNEAKSPTESAIVKTNAIRSEDIKSDKIKKLKILKATTETDSETHSLDSSIAAPPRKLTKKQRLIWLQERHGSGMYVKCDDKKCAKWRWLDNPDPVDLPPKWFCFMNPDNSLAACSVPEFKIPKDVESDLVHNIYSPGSIVWAKMAGYPWWPGMVDDCPDCEQYYWINKHGELIPDYYNVVFFDTTEVARHWILVKNLKSFKHNPDYDKQFKLRLIYKKRMRLAKEKANSALNLHIKDRLKLHSFVALWNKEIPEFLTSSDDDDSDIVEEADYEKRIKKKIIQRRKAYYNQLKDVSSNEKNNKLSQNNSDNKNKIFKTPTKKFKQNVETSKSTKKVKIVSGKYTKAEEQTIPRSNSQKNISNEDKQSLPQEKSKDKEKINGDLSKTVAESKLKNKYNDTKTTKNKQSLVQEKKLNKDLLKIDAEKVKMKSNKNLAEIETTDEKQSLSQEKSKDKENLIKDSPKTVAESKLKIKSNKKCTEPTVDESSNSKGTHIFRPVDRILDESRADFDRDLAQQAYDLCLNLFTSGKHGEAQFEKMYKKITMSNNNEILSLKSETSEAPDKSYEETKKPDTKNQTENISKTPKIKLFEKSHQQTILLQSKGNKRKIENKLSEVVKVIKLAQKAHINANQNTSVNTAPSASNIPKK